MNSCHICCRQVVKKPVSLDIVFRDTKYRLGFKILKKTIHLTLFSLYLTSIRLKPFWLKLPYLASLNRFCVIQQK